MTLPLFTHECAAVPMLMGILNVTPDSFSDGGTLTSPQKVVKKARQHEAAGAQWLDIGAESTRPGAAPISVSEELRRLMPALEAVLNAQLTTRISVDTRRGEVAEQALRAGAHAINDVSAMADPAMGPVVAKACVPIVLMHWAGPSPMGGNHNVAYSDVVLEVCRGLIQARDRAVAAGIAHHNIWLDPGLGFGKGHNHALALTKNLRQVVALGHTVVYGPSRKGFLQEIVSKPSQGCDTATAAVCCVAAMEGAHLLRVHEPSAVRDAAAVGAALRRQSPRALECCLGRPLATPSGQSSLR